MPSSYDLSKKLSTAEKEKVIQSHHGREIKGRIAPRRHVDVLELFYVMQYCHLDDKEKQRDKGTFNINTHLTAAQIDTLTKLIRTAGDKDTRKILLEGLDVLLNNRPHTPLTKILARRAQQSNTSTGRRQRITGREQLEHSSVTTDVLFVIAVLQELRCRYSRVLMLTDPNAGGGKGKRAGLRKLSLERFDNHIGYEVLNVCLVIWGLNNAVTRHDISSIWQEVLEQNLVYKESDPEWPDELLVKAFNLWMDKIGMKAQLIQLGIEKGVVKTQEECQKVLDWMEKNGFGDNGERMGMDEGEEEQEEEEVEMVAKQGKMSAR